MQPAAPFTQQLDTCSVRPPCSGHPGRSPTGWTTPGLAVSNGPSHDPNHGPRRENGGWNRAACAQRLHGAPPLVGPCFQPMAHPQGPPTDLPRVPMDCLNTSPSPQEQPLTEAMHQDNQNREMQQEIMHEHDHGVRIRNNHIKVMHKLCKTVYYYLNGEKRRIQHALIEERSRDTRYRSGGQWIRPNTFEFQPKN
ncbi:general transcription factor 3C polypeptide 5-like [Dorcoceras hygrometricum]|uniref:General transcription factor 3C polypeptide 5-like n=1 Tax=Dorcoceras hygrometricum TaxID=472368 RepID=A0A2Z7CGU2_9LAMI|nr:general transcription factor 3C polypeptide 5-like [Dorcoceras hygrometricum]